MLRPIQPHVPAASMSADKENQLHPQLASQAPPTPGSVRKPSLLLSSSSSFHGGASSHKRPLSVLGQHHGPLSLSLGGVKKLGSFGLGKAQRVAPAVSDAAAAADDDETDAAPPVVVVAAPALPAAAVPSTPLLSPSSSEAPVASPLASLPPFPTLSAAPLATPLPAPLPSIPFTPIAASLPPFPTAAGGSSFPSSSSSASASITPVAAAATPLPPFPAMAPPLTVRSSSPSNSASALASSALSVSLASLSMSSSGTTTSTTPSAKSPHTPPSAVAASTSPSAASAPAVAAAQPVAAPAPAAAPTPVAQVAPVVAAPAPVHAAPAQVAPAPAPIPAPSTPSPSPPPVAAAVAAPVPSPILISPDIVRQPYGFLLGGEKYSKLGQIGKGGSSVVFKVVSTKGVLYALKEIILPAADNASASEELAHQPDHVTEVSNLAALKGDPHIIQMIHAQEDTTSRKFYLLLECGACDLDRHLQQNRADMALTEDSMLLPHYSVRHLFACMLRAVASCHSRGIIHADLKPVNFVFTASATLKLIDFGIAKSVDAGATSAVYERAVGTLNYMSPEALTAEDGAKIRASADVWSLGCILYSLVYGEAPFARWSQAPAKMSRILDRREVIHFPDSITVVEEVAPVAQANQKPLRGNGIAVCISATPPAELAKNPSNTGSVCITRTYPTMPPHLHGVDLPRRSVRSVSPAVREVLRACLQRQPEARPTAAQLMEHEYVRG